MTFDEQLEWFEDAKRRGWNGQVPCRDELGTSFSNEQLESAKDFVFGLIDSKKQSASIYCLGYLPVSALDRRCVCGVEESEHDTWEES